MTTLTKVVYTDRFDANDSSIVRSVFYNEDEQELYVLLRRDDVLCGYAGVPKAVYTSLKLTNENGESVGSYWNTWVKNHYEGIETDDISLLSEEEFQTSLFDFWSNLHEGTSKHSTILDIAPAAEAEAPEVDLEFSDFVVNFTDDLFEDNELSITATSVQDALERFNKIAEIAGWVGVQVTSVTQYFNG